MRLDVGHHYEKSLREAQQLVNQKHTNSPLLPSSQKKEEEEEEKKEIRKDAKKRNRRKQGNRLNKRSRV